MAKKHTLTALLTAAYVIIMITIMLANVNISEKGSFENFYDNNGGLIWACTAIFAFLVGVKKYLDVQGEKETKASYDSYIELEKTIITQNIELKEIQLDHIKEFGKISKQLNDNTANDNKVLKEVINQTSTINNFISDQEKRDNARDDENKQLKKDLQEIKTEIKSKDKDHEEAHDYINTSIQHIQKTLDEHIKEHKKSRV